MDVKLRRQRTFWIADTRSNWQGHIPISTPKSTSIGRNSWSSYLSILDQHEVIKSYNKCQWIIFLPTMHTGCYFMRFLTCISIALSNLCIISFSIPRPLQCHRTLGTCFLKPGSLFIILSATQHKMWWLWSVKNFENTALYLNEVSPKMFDYEKNITPMVYFNHFLVSLLHGTSGATNCITSSVLRNTICIIRALGVLPFIIVDWSCSPIDT